MLGWLRGGPAPPVTGSVIEVNKENRPPQQSSSSSSNHQEVQQQQQQTYNPPAPETPAAAFALKAFRTAVFGTPHPSQAPLQPQLQQQPLIQKPPQQQHHNTSVTAQNTSANTGTSTNNTNKRSSSGALFGGQTIQSLASSGSSDLLSSKDIDRSAAASSSRRDLFRERERAGESSNTSGNNTTNSEKNGKGYDNATVTITRTSTTSNTDPEAIIIDGDSDIEDTTAGGDLSFRTPVKRHISKLPQGILVTPGFTNTRKKAVSFAASTSDQVKPRPQARIRSGLPNEFPGKFPSPWTPRTATPKPIENVGSVKKTLFAVEEAVGETSKPGGAGSEDPAFQAKLDAHADLLKQSNEIIAKFKNDAAFASTTTTPLPTFTSTGDDVTINFDQPKSESGKYWKERVEEVESAYEKTLRKAEKWQEVSKVAKAYAKKKDSQCAELAERLRQAIKENQNLLEDMEELKDTRAMMMHRLTFSSGSKGILLREPGAGGAGDDRNVEELRATVVAYEKQIHALEQLLNKKDEEVAQLSMCVDETPDGGETDDLVRDLKRQLRKCRLELREMTLVKVDNDGKKLRLVTIEKELDECKREKKKLEDELRDIRGVGDTTHIALKNRSLHENRLKLQVERLEQDKINLMAEMREKVSKEANERREMEKKYKNEIRQLDSKLDAASLASERKQMETNDLNRKLADMERLIARRSKELDDALHQVDELRKNVSALAPTSTPRSSSESALWQAKQRTTMQELRQAKEAVSDLQLQLGDKDSELQQKNEELVRLRFKLHAGGTGSRPASPVRAKKEQSSSDPTLAPASTAATSTSTSTTTSRASIIHVEKETDTSEIKMKDVIYDNPRAAASADAMTDDPFVARARISRTPNGTTPSRDRARTPSPKRQQQPSQRETTPSRFLNRTPRSAAKASSAAATAMADLTSSPSRYVTRSPAKNLRTDLFSDSRPVFAVPSEDNQNNNNSGAQSKSAYDWDTTITPQNNTTAAAPTASATTPLNRKLEGLFANSITKPSPRASMIPLEFSPDISSRYTASRRILKRQSLGNESTSTATAGTIGSSSSRKASHHNHHGRRVSSGGISKDSSGSGSGGVAGATSRVVKSSKSGMDPARRAAAEARIAERNRLKARKSEPSFSTFQP